MPNLGPANAPPPLKLLDIIVAALEEIGVVAPGDQAAAQDVDLCRRRANSIFDQWGARRGMVFTVTFPVFALQANHQPHTIGPKGDFDVAKAPVRIVNANLQLASSPTPSNYPISIKDADWWANNRIQGLQSTFPTYLYYERDFPLGSLNFWPVPQQVNNVQLEVWNDFAEFVKAEDQFVAPQGYREALMYEIALSVFPSFWPAKQPNAVTVARAKKALSIVLGNNQRCPSLSLTGQGDPSKVRGDFNWRTGGPR